MRVVHKHHVKHWHYLYRHRRQRALGINTKQMAWSQVLSLIGSVIAGVLLENNKEVLALMVGAFVVLPGVFDLGGSIGASLSAKINHKLENPKAKPLFTLAHSTTYAIALAALAGLLVAFVGAVLSVWFFYADFWQIFWLAEGAIVLSALIGLPIIGVLSVLFRKMRVNPDDVVGPIESSIFDILTIVTMALMIGWLT